MIDELFEKLNDRQRESVKNIEGYVRVIAGPGSGKTKTLVSRYEYLIKIGVPVKNILCVTFTNKAANTMKDRLKSIYGANFTGLIFTFHGFANWLLRREINKLNFPANFNIFDDSDLELVYKDIYDKLNLSKKNMTYKHLSKSILNFKINHLKEYIEYITNPDFNTDINANNEIKEYLINQRKNYFLDFNDLILFILYLFDTYPSEMLKYQKQFEYVLVDEFQDVTSSEYALVELVSSYHKNLFVVGDPDQRIYTWRGAQDFITNFHLDECKTIILDKNYRSTPEIISFSNSLIEKNSDRLDKKMVPSKTSGDKPLYYHAKTSVLEANWICDEIKTLVKNGVKYNEIAILYRSNRHSRFIEESLLKHKIQYKIYGGFSFYERREIKDLISYLRFLIHKDDFSFKRIINTPSRGFGKVKMEYLLELQKNTKLSLYELLCIHKDDSVLSKSQISDFLTLIKDASSMFNGKISDLLTFIYQKSGYEKQLMTKDDDERIENVNELLYSVKKLEDSYGEKYLLSDYLQDIALLTNHNETEDTKISLMSVHMAKGLEFDYVFVCSLSEGNFPSSKSISPEDIEEERRIAYVAFTRARKRLYLSDSTNNYNNEITSRFIGDIDKELINFITKPILENYVYNTIHIRRINNVNISKGDIIFHNVLGSGIVINVNGDIIKVKFDKINTIRTITYSDELVNIVGHNIFSGDSKKEVNSTKNEVVKTNNNNRVKVNNKYSVKKKKIKNKLSKRDKQTISYIIRILLFLIALLFVIYMSK